MAEGFTQEEGVDYHEVFSFMVNHTSIRAILSIVEQMNLELDKMDMKITFVHGHFKETINMHY